MSGLIPESFIEELLARVDIVEVLERRMALKKTGSEYQGLCPFHDEKTPSFTVSPRKQFFHCFGCGAHGSAIGFLMRFEGLEFRDAVEDLAHSAGLKLPVAESVAPAARPRDDLHELMEEVARFYQAALKASPQAVNYLQKRGLSGEVCRDFGIGYAGADWDQLLKHFGSTAERVQLLARAGLLSQGPNKSYDKFRDRIMFPIHDRRGRAIGFGGRTIGEDGPKYLNSPETELFHKGRELYGLYLARQRVGRLDEILVVEGYMDVVALAQHGIRNCVATLGTATTAEQASLLLRASDTVVYCFDGDTAGRKAAWRALEATLPRLVAGKQARFLFLPDGEDPDSLVRKEGAAAFNARLETAESLSGFFFRHLSEDLSLQSVDGRARLVQLASPYLDSLPEGVFQDMMREQLEQLARHRLRPTAGQGPEKRGDSGSATHPGRSMRNTTSSRPFTQPRTPMRVAMAHLVQNPGLVELVPDLADLDAAGQAGLDILQELVDFCRKRPNITTAQLLELMRERPAHPHLVKLAVWPLPGDPEDLALEFLDSVAGLRLQQVRNRIAALPRIVDQGPAQREEFRALQREERDLLDRIQGHKTQ